jgi:geranylgeranylglycerol-phosphate geranylgeranyltransferase
LTIKNQKITSKIWSKTVAYLELTKIFNSSKSTLYYGFCSFIGSLLASSWTLPIRTSLTTALAITLSTFAIYALNDIYDAKIDAINDLERPIPSGRATMREAKYLSIVLFVVGAAIAATVNLQVFLFTVTLSVLGIAYSVPPLRFKDGMFANVCWGLGIATTILGGASVTSINTSSLIAAFTLAFLTAGCGLTKDLKDLEGDKAVNVHTLPIMLGEPGAIKVMTIAAFAGFPLLFFSFMFINFNIVALATITLTIALFAYSLLVLYKNPGSKIIYKKAYKLQAYAGFLIIVAFMISALT